jgi:hypothetical protein
MFIIAGKSNANVAKKYLMLIYTNITAKASVFSNCKCTTNLIDILSQIFTCEYMGQLFPGPYRDI